MSSELSFLPMLNNSKKQMVKKLSFEFNSTNFEEDILFKRMKTHIKLKLNIRSRFPNTLVSIERIIFPFVSSFRK